MENTKEKNKREKIKEKRKTRFLQGTFVFVGIYVYDMIWYDVNALWNESSQGNIFNVFNREDI